MTGGRQWEHVITNHVTRADPGGKWVDNPAHHPVSNNTLGVQLNQCISEGAQRTRGQKRWLDSYDRV